MIPVPPDSYALPPARPARSGRQARYTVNDPYNLQRFLDAQADIYEQALAELRAGRKTSHWIWWVFPQIAGLGVSARSQYYALKSLAEGRAFLEHPTLGARLIHAADTLLAAEGRSATAILGTPDDLKVRSCATLFSAISAPGSVFHRILDHFFDGEPDPRTVAILQGGRQPD